MICVLLSTYNGEKFIKEQIDTILAQINVDLHLVIRDDSSSDSTCDIIEEYITKYPQKIDFIKGKNLGFALSFSELIKYSYEKYPKCEYFAFADQDDVWLKNKLSIAINLLSREATDIPITYCSNKHLVDEKLNFIRYAWTQQEVKLTKERCIIQSFATGCTMVFNKAAAKIYISHLPEQIKVHDYLMYQQCMFLGKVINDHNSYILYRQHSSNQIGSPSFSNRMKRRLKTANYKKHTLEQQNYYFLKSYKDLLTIEDIELLSSFIFYRKNIFTKLSLLFNSKIRYTSLELNIFYFAKILFGGV